MPPCCLAEKLVNPYALESNTPPRAQSIGGEAPATLRAIFIIICLLAHLLRLPLLLGAAGTTSTGGLRRFPARRRLLLATAGGGLLLRSGLGHGCLVA